jgi:hypothetical protein
MDEITDKLQEFIGEEIPDIDIKQLDEVLHSMNELQLWPDYVDSVSNEQVILCWRIIETLKRKELPNDLKM